MKVAPPQLWFAYQIRYTAASLSSAFGLVHQSYVHNGSDQDAMVTVTRHPSLWHPLLTGDFQYCLFFMNLPTEEDRASPQAVIVRPRVYIGESISLGPGKIDLLRLIAEHRSISAAARALEIPYKRAWLLIDSLNQGFGKPVVATASGGKGGGGAVVTQLGLDLLKGYALLERRINDSSVAELEALRRLAE